MYEVIIPNSVKKDLKKLDRAVAKIIIQQLVELANKPALGTPLSGNLSYLNKLEVCHRTVEYRIYIPMISSIVVPFNRWVRNLVNKLVSGKGSSRLRPTNHL
mgnify:CR=1 FL=1